MPTIQKLTIACILFAGTMLTYRSGLAQPTWTFNPFGNEKKPKQFEEKILGSEKTATKKFTFLRKVSQNTVSHYNYFFNANRKLNLVIEQATVSQQDDYSKQLSFYPYSLENTAGQKTELDSVIYKCTAGILLHDLRTEWVDNMYLLIGKAYYFRKQFDSAALTFQFINYNLYPRGKKDQEDRIIGEGSTQTGSSLSIANREKRNWLQRVFTQPPSRNESLIWLARTYIEQDLLGESAGLINILQHDPNLPKRLKDDLNQVTAYWYFKQNVTDSTLTYLERALSSAETKAEKARWYFLLAQLSEQAGQFEQAAKYYEKAAIATVDPLMDIYARLNKARMFKGQGSEEELTASVNNLLKLARKDRYQSYRDIIYHSAGILAMRIPDTAQAVLFFEKALQYNNGNLGNKNKAHVQLADIAFQKKNYIIASSHYDSLDLVHPSLSQDSAAIALRKDVSKRLAAYTSTIQREDSLQAIALLPPAERDQLLKKLSKKLRKGEVADGADDPGIQNGLSSSFSTTTAPADLFQTSSKGDWYFYNASVKSKGFNEFKSKWGKRENVDNWRRQSALMVMANPDITDPLAPIPTDSSANDPTGKPIPNSYDDLLSQIPLTPERIDSSNQQIKTALLMMARVFEYELTDYPQALEMYEQYRQRFPDSLDADVLLGLYHTHSKLGNQTEANQYKEMLARTFPNSEQNRLLTNPSSVKRTVNTPEMTASYDAIYQAFISGDMVKALQLKQQADSVYGSHYWTPPLLFLESAAYLKQRKDSLAQQSLQWLIQRFPESPLKPRAEHLLKIISQRDSL
ncbi:MAG: tetratricopeptide repeat protein, partial [Ferruginibacter sp.]